MDEQSTQKRIALALIRPSRWQYRQRFDPEGLLELARSIESHGIINPPLVFLDEDQYYYELIAGERRVRASIALALRDSGYWIAEHGDDLATAVRHIAERGWEGLTDDLLRDLALHFIRCEVRPGQADDFREIVVLENLQRRDPSPLEEAHGFQILIEDGGYTQSDLAARLGKSQAYISQRLSLLGLAPDVADAEMPFAVLRSVATLPQEAQPDIMTYIQSLPPTETTSRKIQRLTRLARRFLDPATWDPPADQVLHPHTRNRLRLIQHFVRRLPAERGGEVVVDLHRRGYLGREPLTIARDEYLCHLIVGALGAPDWEQYERDRPWEDLAPAQDWDCTHCQFRHIARPPATGMMPLCRRWAKPDEEGITTCWAFIADDDPLVLPQEGYGGDLAIALDAGHGDNLQRTERGMHYVIDLETYAAIQADIGRARAEKQAALKQEQETGYLRNLWAYWRLQSDPDSPLGAGIYGDMAARCTKCANHRPDLLDQGLPPCRFAVEPLHQYGQAVAPFMGFLVAQNGLMAPRCDRFYYRDMPDLVLSGSGWKFSSRAEVLRWLSGISRGTSDSSQSILRPPLAWLPYERGSVRHNAAALHDYLIHHWDEIGDDGIACLLGIAVSEAGAIGRRPPFELAGPLSRQKWAAVRWYDVAQGRQPWTWPDNWAAPWLDEAWREKFTRVMGGEGLKAS
ncbi:MAG TPA: hypothetical protein ENJ31_01500 [Anaerolineae bacterium]|nr:hypothetical protein [Anaerolineae bacterium]